MSIAGVSHNCKQSGVCFNDVHRLKFGAFEDCWKRWNHNRRKWEKSTCKPTDVDFLIEQKGNFLMMEFKAGSSAFNMGSGQGIMFRQLARIADISVILCDGSAKDMTVSKISVLSRGYCSGPMPATIEGLVDILTRWSVWAESNPKQAVFKDTAKPEWFTD